MSSLTPSPVQSPSSPRPKFLPEFMPPCPTEHFFPLDVQIDCNLCASYFAASNLYLRCYRDYEKMVDKEYDRMIKELETRVEEGIVVEELNIEVERLETRRMEELGRLKEERRWITEG
ncbi:hypothetical protein G7Y79_00046g082100 [Physcia stellaris]|nr:hypothetical protein G7Y79_00046g082100 [Physcia stellaris]